MRHELRPRDHASAFEGRGVGAGGHVPAALDGDKELLRGQPAQLALEVLAVLEDAGSREFERRRVGGRERRRLQEGLVAGRTRVEPRVGERDPQDAFAGFRDGAGQPGFARVDRLDESAAVVDAPEPEVAQDFAVARAGADDHAGELAVELAGHDDRGGIIFGRTHEQAAVFGVRVGRHLEVEPG